MKPISRKRLIRYLTDACAIYKEDIEDYEQLIKDIGEAKNGLEAVDADGAQRRLDTIIGRLGASESLLWGLHAGDFDEDKDES